MRQQQAILFAAGVLVSAFSPVLAGWLVKIRAGVGWVYYGSITLRMLAMLVGGSAVYLLASPGAGPLIGAYALGIAVASLVHAVVALVRLAE